MLILPTAGPLGDRAVHYRLEYLVQQSMLPTELITITADGSLSVLMVLQQYLLMVVYLGLLAAAWEPVHGLR